VPIGWFARRRHEHGFLTPHAALAAALRFAHGRRR